MAETDIYRRQNFGNRIGFGNKSALLVVDFLERDEIVSALKSR